MFTGLDLILLVTGTRMIDFNVGDEEGNDRLNVGDEEGNDRF